jgi:ABC-type polysaccharide/polyol phosphate transport system ATPase subunit
MARIELSNVSVEFPIYNLHARSLKKQFLRLTTGGNVAKDAKQRVIVRSLNNISLSLHQGDRVGLIGGNGAGKSTLLNVLAKIYEPTEGKVQINGHVSPLLNLIQGIESEFTGYENIVIRGIILGLSRKEINNKMNQIAELTGLGDYLAMPVRTYSNGMMMRLAFAISASIEPDILLIDEVFGAGDAEFMEKARARMVSLLNQSNIVVMATHSDILMKEFCNKGLLLEAGSIKYFGSLENALEMYHTGIK